MKPGELAARAGLQPQTIYNLESGSCGVSAETLSRIARVLRVQVKDISGNPDESQ
jgi:DNA-binding XRE family transcriptional regulator